MQGLGDLRRLAVLQVVNIDALLVHVARLVEPLDPGTRLIEQPPFARQHHHRVHALDRHEADGARLRILARRAEDVLQLDHDGRGLGVLERQQGHRRAVERVDVEDAERILDKLELVARAAHHEKMAPLVGNEGDARRQHLGEDGDDVAHRDIAHRKDLDALADGRCGRERRRGARLAVGGPRHDADDAVRLDQREAAALEHRLEDVQHLARGAAAG